MITTISSQTFGGTYQDSKFRKNVEIEWKEETKPTSFWQRDLSYWWLAILTQNSENLLTQDGEILEIEQWEDLNWSPDLNNPSTTWINA